MSQAAIDLVLSDDVPCRDCGCDRHSSRQSRQEHEWRLCDGHDDGFHDAGRCDPAGSRRRVEPLEPCGTYAAYKRHLRREEPVDAECRAAARQESVAYWHRRATRSS